MTNITTVEEDWGLYWKSIAPGGAGEIQTRETKRAFYAGYFSTFVMLRKAADLPESEGVDDLQARAEEVAEFFKDVQ